MWRFIFQIYYLICQKEKVMRLRPDSDEPRTSSCPEVFLRKGVLKKWDKFTGEHPCRSVTSVKLQSNFIETTPRRGSSPVNLMHIFRTPFLKNTSGGCFSRTFSLQFLKTIWDYIFIETRLDVFTRYFINKFSSCQPNVSNHIKYHKQIIYKNNVAKFLKICIALVVIR